jgi:hypothetical protein
MVFFFPEKYNGKLNCLRSANYEDVNYYLFKLKHWFFFPPNLATVLQFPNDYLGEEVSGLIYGYACPKIFHLSRTCPLKC